MAFFSSSSSSSSASASSSSSMTPENLHQAVREKDYARIINIIFDHPEFVNQSEKTAMMLAIELKDLTAQRLLSCCESDPEILQHSDPTKLKDSTLKHNDPTHCETIITEFIKAINDNNYQAMIDVLFSHPELCEIPIGQGEEQNFILKYAVEKKKITLIKLLLLFGATVDIKDSHNKTPLYWAVFYCSSALTEYLEVIKLLIGRGADANSSCSTQKGFNSSPRLLAEVVESDKKEITAIFNHAPKKQPKTLQRYPSQLFLEVGSTLNLELSGKSSSPELPNSFFFRRANSI